MENKKLELICGRLGSDPKLAYTKKQEAVCEFSIALNDESSEVVWRKIVVFGKLAELCKVHLKKGNEVFVRGRIRLSKYANKDGEEKEYTAVLAHSVALELMKL